MAQKVENYCNQLWAPVYEQYYGDDHAQEWPFYQRWAHDLGGRILELGCGTGLLFYKLLRADLDIHGLDISTHMLDVLIRKAEVHERAEVARRISCQSMIDFAVDGKFDQVYIPARAFLHASSLHDQLATLRRVHAHLAPGGRLLLNFFVPELEQIQAATQNPQFEPFDRLRHTLSGEAVELHIRRAVPDISAQRFEVTWRFLQAGRVDETRMDLRWVNHDEFLLMLQLTGFSAWQVFADAQGRPFGPDATEMYWVVER